MPVAGAPSMAMMRSPDLMPESSAGLPAAVRAASVPVRVHDPGRETRTGTLGEPLPQAGSFASRARRSGRGHLTSRAHPSFSKTQITRAETSI